MIYEKIELNKHYSKLKSNALLTALCPENCPEIELERKRKCLLILPGGGYNYTSKRESDPIAFKFLAEDIACFILNYSVAPLQYPYPLVDVYAALSYIRRNADVYHINPDKISVLGFSAGGHLAGITCCNHMNQEYADYLDIPLEEMKINGCLLGYPVIAKEVGHAVSFKNITQENPELIEKMSVEKHVTKDFPKTFMWHTAYDLTVDVRNSLILATKLRENDVLFELHVYPWGGHGQSLANRTVYGPHALTDEQINDHKYNTQWIDQAIHFIKEYI